MGAYRIHPDIYSGRIQPQFWAPLQTSLALARGTGSPTFTRATTGTTEDHEQRIYNVLSGEARFKGARRVRNLLTDSHAMTHANWTLASVTRTTGVADPLGGTTAITITATSSGSAVAFYQQVTVANVTGAEYRASVWIRRRTGTGAVIFRRVDNTDEDITAQLTGSWQRFTSTVSGAQIGVNAFHVVNPQVSGDEVDYWHPLLEEVTGQSNQNPSEYVSVGVLSAPYHGAGVDGVKLFATENGNTVASNVVTEATGAAISSSTLLGYLSEQASTNLCLQSENFGTTWTAGGTPTRSAAALRCGAVVLDRIGDDAAGAFESYSQVITFTGNAVKAISFFFAKGTATTTTVRLDDALPAIRLHAEITWSGSTPSISTALGGTLLGIDTLGNGVFRARLATTSVTAANTNTLTVYMAGDAAAANTGDVDMGGVQAENSTFCTSYIPTTTATVTRNADALTYPTSGNFSDTAGTIYGEATINNPAGQQNNQVPLSGGGFGPIYISAGASFSSFDGATTITQGVWADNTLTKVAVAWGGSARSLTQGGAAPTAGTYDGSFNGGASLLVPSASASATVRNVKIWARALSDSQLQIMTS